MRGEAVERGRARAAQGMTFLSLLLMGFLAVAQLRSGRKVSEAPEVRTRNLYALAIMLRREREVRGRLEAEVAQLRAQLEQYERAQAEGQSIAASLRAQVEQLRLALGLVRVTGPGVVVRISAPKTPPQQGPVLVQYQDLVAIANELWAAGAEAMAVNGQRITATSGFSQVGGTILVNLQRLSPPYEIAAIGDPATLEGALAIRGGLVEGLRGLGLEIRVERREQLELPPYGGSFEFRHARPGK
ncbi:MAG: DUF881 domain-containing protein [Armatimonadota bacterium]|nr:DUF881 domain-containing protein [Armatimonadota bacterium]MDR7562200.1 DUF881 domain-containing protein [Armatimonadota bacterium]MDR7567714.1 DUF881 domain-containing protein [Armatimonadota bacterium]MDR7602808.1 DUF881 domain-containing protein [Armatimonadota bacterium]